MRRTENIQEEADMKAGLLYRMNLEMKPGLWAKKVLELADMERRDQRDSVRKAGYDIRDTAKELQEFYIRVEEESDGRE